MRDDKLAAPAAARRTGAVRDDQSPGTIDWRSPVRLTLGGLLAFASAQALHLPNGLWAVLTALIVMRAHPGRTMRAGRDRLIGTLCGAGIALAGSALRLLQVPELATVALILAASSSVVAWRPGFRTAPIAAIIVASSGSAAFSPVFAAAVRVAEIALGAAIGFAVSWLFFIADARLMRSRPAASMRQGQRQGATATPTNPTAR